MHRVNLIVLRSTSDSPNRALKSCMELSYKNIDISEEQEPAGKTCQHKTSECLLSLKM